MLPLQQQVVRDEIVTNPNNLVIFLNFAGFLTESTEKNLRNLRENYRSIDSLWQHKDLQEKGIMLNPPRGDMYNIRLVIDPPISKDASHDYPGMQAHSVNLDVDVSDGSGSVTATLTADGEPITAQENQLAKWDHKSNPPDSTSIYRLKVVGGASGGKYQVTGLWKDFSYDEQFVEVASRGTTIT